jgi:hypothetical protein
MADDRHYVGGDNYLLDDLSGFKIRASRARIIPGGITGNLAVAPQRWEPQQPQDFVRGVYDDITVALARPRQKNQFVIVGTYVTAPSAPQTRTITVDSSNGFSVGSPVLVMLDSGENFQTRIASITGFVWTLVDPLPASVGSLYGDPIENSILLLTAEAGLGFFVLDSAEGVLNVNVLG